MNIRERPPNPRKSTCSICKRKRRVVWTPHRPEDVELDWATKICDTCDVV